MILICIFLIGDFEHLFMYLLSTCMSSFEKWPLSSSAHFQLGCFLLLSCMSSLSILYINCLLCVSFTDIFSHSVGSLLCYWWFSSLCRLLIYCYLFVYFCLVSLAWKDISRKILLRLMSKNILLMFSLKGFMVSGLTLRFLIHFE